MSRHRFIKVNRPENGCWRRVCTALLEESDIFRREFAHWVSLQHHRNHFHNFFILKSKELLVARIKYLKKFGPNPIWRNFD